MANVAKRLGVPTGSDDVSWEDPRLIEGLSGQDILDMDDADLALKLRISLHRAAEEARSDIKKFCEFVMREETTRAPIKLAPHQLVFLDFVMAHDRCVVMMPIGHSKTFLMAALTLFLLGNDVTQRGAVVSATQGQAEKVVMMVRDYIENSAELHLVFPHLMPSQRAGDPWTQTRITVDRPAGIRDASLMAVGVHGAIDGSRLSWILVDDVLSEENTSTQEQRESTRSWLKTTVQARLDFTRGRMVVTNTARHPDDVAHVLSKPQPEGPGWALLRMDVLGDIEIRDDDERMFDGRPPWDSEELRPSTKHPYMCRLVRHDPDPNEEMTLWPDKIPPSAIPKLRREYLEREFNQIFRQICRDDASALCKEEWIAEAKRLARLAGLFATPVRYQNNGSLVITGVDLAMGQKEKHDRTCLCTVEFRQDGRRAVLEVESGRWDGPTILDKMFDRYTKYGSILVVESNAAQQFVLQFAIDKYAGLPVVPHTTTVVNKNQAEFGVNGLFVELMNGAWLFPNSRRGVCPAGIEKLVQACLHYSTAAKHTPDELMAMWFAREQARKMGVIAGRATSIFGATAAASDSPGVAGMLLVR